MNTEQWGPEQLRREWLAGMGMTPEEIDLHVASDPPVSVVVELEQLEHLDRIRELNAR